MRDLTLYIYTHLRLVLCFAIVNICNTIFAYEFTDNGIYYHITSDSTVAVTYGVHEANSYNGEIFIPSTVYYKGNGYSVFSISGRAFYGCEGLVSVELPNSIKSIGYESFYGCSSLKAINLPEGLQSIGENAFMGCKTLSVIKFPESLTTIEDHAFWGCSTITTLYIPSKLTSIVNNPFEGCNSISSIIVSENNVAYDSRDNCNGIIDKSNRSFLCGCKNSTIPSSVYSIGRYAFKACTGITSVVVPSSVHTIGAYAFNDCTGLISVTIGQAVTNIEDKYSESPGSTTIGCNPFGGCINLANIIVDNQNKKYDSRLNCNAIIETETNKLIIGCKSTNIPNDVTCIGASSFINSNNLSNICIPASVIKIEERAFMNCINLESIDIPNNVESIGSESFYGCSSIKKIMIGESVGNIGNYAFRNCTNLIQVTNKSLTPQRAYADEYERSIFRGIDISIVNLIVPYQSLDKYKTEYIWKDFGSITSNDVLATSISLSSQNINLFVGDSVSLGVTIKPKDVTYNNLEWSSSNNTVVAVNNGVVKGLREGSAIITANTTDGSGLKATCSVNVTPVLISSISLSTTEANINVGDRFTLSANITPSNATNKQVTWSSSNTNIATVDNGIVIGVNPGSAVITVKTCDGSNLTATSTITVKQISATMITLDKQSLDLYVGDKTTITASISPNNATYKDVNWSSSNANVIIVENGNVTAIGAGKASIIASTTDGSNLQASCQITVSKRTQSINWSQSFNNVLYGGEMIALNATSTSGLPISYKSGNESLISIFNLDNAVYLNPGNCGTTTITAKQEGNNEYLPVELIKDVSVINNDISTSKTLVAYYSTSTLIDEIVSELANQLSYTTSAYTLKITPTDSRINSATKELRDSLIYAINSSPNDIKSYPSINDIDVNVADYDNIMLVYPLWGTYMAAPMQTFNFKYKSILASKLPSYIEFDDYGTAGESSNAKVLRLTLNDNEDRSIPISEWLKNQSSTGVKEVNIGGGVGSNIYDLNGRKLNIMPSHGVYIINGRKIVK